MNQLIGKYGRFTFERIHNTKEQIIFLRFHDSKEPFSQVMTSQVIMK